MERITVLLALMSLDAGGAETHMISLANQLKKNGVRVLVTSHGGKLTSQLHEMGIEHFTLSLDKKTPMSLMTSISGMIRLVKEYDVDIIHAHARIPAWITQWVTCITGCPFITTSHGIYSTKWGMGLITAWGKEIIAVSDDVRKHLIKNFKVPPEKIHVIPNGIDLEKFDPAIDTLQVEKEFNLLPEDLKIVYISRLMGPRGEIAIKLIQSMPEIERHFPSTKLLVVGEGDKYKAIKSMADDYNKSRGQQKVIVTGARVDTPALMNLADVAVGVGRVALEAMAMKKPVIIAGEAGFMGILTPEKFSLAKQHNFSGRGTHTMTEAHGLAEAIIDLFKNPEKRRELGEFGRESVHKYFSIETMTEQVLKVYHRVIEEENK